LARIRRVGLHAQNDRGDVVLAAALVGMVNQLLWNGGHMVGAEEAGDVILFQVAVQSI